MEKADHTLFLENLMSRHHWDAVLTLVSALDAFDLDSFPGFFPVQVFSLTQAWCSFLLSRLCSASLSTETKPKDT